jgi:uncharacterized protein
MDTLFLAFITGLTTGGISCLAVQGGLLTTVVSQNSEQHSDSRIVGMFLVAKIVAYTLLGFGLGLIGASLQITPQLQGWLQIGAGVFMILTAARLLDLHPVFRKFVIQPPKSFYKLVRKESKLQSSFAPLLLGALTVLIPCGITQGMMVLAIASASPLEGAGIMFAFTLGASPIFFILGLASAKLFQKKAFIYAASFVIIVLGILSINTGQVLRGSVHTIQNYLMVATTNPNDASVEKVAGTSTEGLQEVTIAVSDYGYKADTNTLTSGVPVKLHLLSQNVGGCARAFIIPSLNISKVLPENGEESLEFTPTKKGVLTYSCSMGMYSGQFRVI